MQKTIPSIIGIVPRQAASAEKLEIHYTILSRDFGGDVPHRGYGLRATLYRDGKRVDESTVEDISVNLDEVEKFGRLMAACTVTPATLRDIVEDYLSCPDEYRKKFVIKKENSA